MRPATRTCRPRSSFLDVSRFPRTVTGPAGGTGFIIKEIFNRTKIDKWFLVQIIGMADFEEELATAKN